MRVPILMYHKISPPTRATRLKGLCTSRQALDRQLGRLRRLGYSFCDFEDLRKALDREASLPDKPILLTFDDGYADNYSTAFPLLLKHRAKATLFLIAEDVGKTSLVWPDAMETEPTSLMTWDQAREMSRQGISVQSHGMTHRRLSRLSPEEIKKELQDSRRAIEREIGVRPIAYAFPYGVKREAARAIAETAGYRFLCTTESGVNDWETLDPFALKRLLISRHRWRHDLAFFWRSRNGFAGA
ncbi:MAG: polysaccharide deacetylase family protein [Candidatus Sumerlaeota bacterium]|nr:polysaccharide deacetylase family protein [Candidatus Sumerlaeota bacterium]